MVRIINIFCFQIFWRSSPAARGAGVSHREGRGRKNGHDRSVR